MSATLNAIVREARMMLTTDNEEYIVLKAAWMRDSPTNSGKETDGTANKGRHLASAFGISEDASILLNIAAGVAEGKRAKTTVQKALENWSKSRVKYGNPVLSRVKDDLRCLIRNGHKALVSLQSKWSHQGALLLIPCLLFAGAKTRFPPASCPPHQDASRIPAFLAVAFSQSSLPSASVVSDPAWRTCRHSWQVYVKDEESVASAADG